MLTTATLMLAATALLNLDPDQQMIPPVEQCEAIYFDTSSLSWMLRILPDGSGVLVYGSADGAPVRKGTFDFERIYKKVSRIGLTGDEAKSINDQREERGEKPRPMSGLRFASGKRKKRDETTRARLYLDDDQFVAGLFEKAHKNLTRDNRFDLLFLLYRPGKDSEEWSRPFLTGEEPLPKPDEFQQISIYTQGGWQIQIRRNGSGFLAFGRPGFEATFPKNTFDFEDTYKKLIVSVEVMSRLRSGKAQAPTWAYHYPVGLKRPRQRVQFAFYCPDRELLREIFDRAKEASTPVSLPEEFPARPYDKFWQLWPPIPAEEEGK